MKRQRSDDNQTALVKLYRKLGCEVEIVSQFLSCDLIVGCNKTIDWVEVKDGDKEPARRKLSDKEKKFQTRWGLIKPVVNVKNAEEVMAHVYRMKGMSSGQSAAFELGVYS